MNTQIVMENLGKNFWTSRYQNNLIGWDLGHASKPITEFINSLDDKTLKILIPGAGNAYEAEYLWEHGFRNIHILDIAEPPLRSLKTRIPDLPLSQVYLSDFFDHQGSYDLILEQTFFCALDPILRENYVSKMYELISKTGCLAGVLFDFPLTDEGPPFGGNQNIYRDLFQGTFKISTLERCYNSEGSRLGKELFFIFEKN